MSSITYFNVLAAQSKAAEAAHEEQASAGATSAASAASQFKDIFGDDSDGSLDLGTGISISITLISYHSSSA